MRMFENCYSQSESEARSQCSADCGEGNVDSVFEFNANVSLRNFQHGELRAFTFPGSNQIRICRDVEEAAYAFSYHTSARFLLNYLRHRRKQKSTAVLSTHQSIRMH